MAKSFTVFQDVELSFTENLIPTHIPVKQYDNQARKVRCRLYQNSLEYKVSYHSSHALTVRFPKTGKTENISK